MQPGDFVLIQFGHNDGGDIQKGKARGELKGTGDESKVVMVEKTGIYEAVYTYGWYLKKFIMDVQEKGAVPVILSPTPRNIWKEGKLSLIHILSGTLWRHRPDNTFEPLHLIPSDILSLISQERYQIYHDSRNIIWITTFGNGLFAIDENNGKIFHYTADKDLTTNYLLCVTEDRSGEIWVGTELGGISKISLTNYPFDIFYPSPDVYKRQSQWGGEKDEEVGLEPIS